MLYICLLNQFNQNTIGLTRLPFFMNSISCKDEKLVFWDAKNMYEKKKFRLSQNNFQNNCYSYLKKKIMSWTFLIWCLLLKTFGNLTFENLRASYSCIKASYRFAQCAIIFKTIARKLWKIGEKKFAASVTVL